jgi:hypothetical protein
MQTACEKVNMPRAILSAILCLAGLSACSASSSPSGDAREMRAANEHLLGAPADPGHTFDVGVCAMGTKADGTCAGGRCSGTLIASNVVLTARHCIDDIAYANDWCASTFTTPLSSKTTLVTTSDSVRIGAPKWYEVQKRLVPANNTLCGDDLAILILATDVPASEANPVRVDPSFDYAKHPPTSVAVVGRGGIAEAIDGTFDNGSGLRRVLENIPFVCATNSANAPCNVVDYSSPPTNMFASPPSYYVIGASLASGDSGSGVFNQDHFHTNGRLAVMGVSVAGTWAADGLPNYGLVLRLDGHKGFIKDALLAAGHEAQLDE